MAQKYSKYPDKYELFSRVLPDFSGLLQSTALPLKFY